MYMAVSANWRVLLVGVLLIRALLFGVNFEALSSNSQKESGLDVCLW